MPTIRLIPDDTHVPFLRYRRPATIASAVLLALSLLAVAVFGLNFGIDFRGGTLIEIRTEQPADLGTLRSDLNGLGLGEVALQNFGSPNDVLIRVEQQAGDDEAQAQAVATVRAALTERLGEGVSFRRVEFVGPKVSQELLRDGLLAVSLSLVGVLVYLWFRFEWQFGVGAIVAILHDVALTFGLFAVTGLEFNLATIAAVLTIVGYSLNDTVVIFDRVRENLRKYRKQPLLDLLDRSLNETLARTVVTSGTTLLALIVLFVVGPMVIAGFTFAMIFGILVGTYSTLYIASPVVLALNVRADPPQAQARFAGAEKTE